MPTIGAADLLAGKVPPPEAASALYDVIEAAEAMSEEGLPRTSGVDTASPGYEIFG